MDVTMNWRRETGLTLVEILVAMVIGIVLVGGISQVYISLNQTNKISQSLSNLQESTRLNGDLLFQDLSHVGYLGCADPMQTNPIVHYNNAPTHITDFVANALSGWEVDAINWGDDPALDDINQTGNKNAIMNSDVFRVKYLSRSNLSLAAAMGSHTADIQLTNDIFGLKADDVVAIGDCENVEIFKVTGKSETPLSIAHSSTLNSSGAFNKAYDNLENTSVRVLLSNTYFVADTGRQNSSGDSISALFRQGRGGGTPEEIAEGVENMQILYGEEIVTDPCNPANNRVRFVEADDPDLDMSRVSVMKVGLLMASNERILTRDDDSTYLLLNQPVTASGTELTYANDRRMRKAVNMTINIRNRRTTQECTF